jgi:pimeloyl-ACP methyl ester carboxylesterase
MNEARRQTTPSRPGSRRIPRWLLVGIAVVVGLAAALAIDVGRSGGPRSWLFRHGLGALATATYDARGRLVEVQGRSLYLDCRGSGSPTVVLIAGMGTGAETWAAILPELAGKTRVCAYDRPGIGRSAGGSTPDHVAAAADLRALLATAGEVPPYVLVGHSLGADMARVMASVDRDRVVGLGLIDGFEPDLFEAAVAPLLGPYAAEYLDRQEGLWDLVTRTEGLDRDRSLAQLAAVDLRGLPIEVVRPARAEPRLDETANERIRAGQAAGYEGLSPGAVRLTLAYGSGHVVQVDRPDLVVDAIERLVTTARARS